MDSQVGRLYEMLEQTNQLENTVIIFASDNGGDTHANNGPVRGQKGEMFEGGIRVAAGVYWKGQFKPAVTENFAMLSDIFPTVCELTGSAYSHEIDGISILPTLQGKSQVTDDRTVFWVRREGGYRFGGKATYAARYKSTKLLQNAPFDPLLYFNLEHDPNESYSLPLESTDIFKKVFHALMDHIRIIGAVPFQKP